LSLREDNADERLTRIGRDLGLVDDIRWSAFQDKRDLVSRETNWLTNTWVSPKNVDVAEMERVIGQPIEREYRLIDLLRRSEIGYRALTSLRDKNGALFTQGIVDDSIAAQVEINVKYAGYVDRQRDEVDRVSGFENLPLSDAIDYRGVRGLSFEACQKLTQQRPATLGEAARIAGVTPATISLLLVHLKRGLGRTGREVDHVDETARVQKRARSRRRGVVIKSIGCSPAGGTTGVRDRGTGCRRRRRRAGPPAAIPWPAGQMEQGLQPDVGP
jgi:tRNA uridine 5-carboxymethylaminomethyl modification enzyme